MINACIQKIPVMGYQNKSFFSCQIFLYRLSRFPVQVIRRFIDQKEIIFPGKQNRQHHLGPLAKTQRSKRSVQNPAVQSKFIQFAENPPLLYSGFQLIHEFRCGPLHILLFYLIRKIIERRIRADRTLVFIFSEQQVQKSRFSLSIPSYKSQLPIRVNGKRHIFKYIVKTSLIIKSEVIYAYPCHFNSSSQLSPKESMPVK